MPKLCFILGDGLNESISSLQHIDKKNDIVFLCEVVEEATYVPHHPKKIAFNMMIQKIQGILRANYYAPSKKQMQKKCMLLILGNIGF